jgi:hypothetical protein
VALQGADPQSNNSTVSVEKYEPEEGAWAQRKGYPLMRYQEVTTISYAEARNNIKIGINCDKEDIRTEETHEHQAATYNYITWTNGRRS